MNANYPNGRAVAEFIAQLMQEPYFLDGTLTMYADVPVKCLRYEPDFCTERENLCSAPDKYRFDAFDFLVCRGNTAVACICFNYDQERSRLNELFGSYLQGLDCIGCSADYLDDFALAEFYPSVAQRLSVYAESGASDYTLEPVRVDADLMTLKKSCLLEDDGYAAVFRRDCGIFYRCYTDEDGTLCQEPRTCTKPFQEQVNALSWKKEANGNSRELRELLDMPLQRLCGENTKRCAEFQMLLNAFRGALRGFPAIQFTDTFRQFLHAHADCHRRPRHAFPDWKAVYLVMARLEQLLAEAIRDAEHPFFKVPLHRYYAAAADLAGCYYPLWLYRSLIRPQLCSGQADECTMSGYAGYEHANLTLLMVEPICLPGRE